LLKRRRDEMILKARWQMLEREKEKHKGES